MTESNRKLPSQLVEPNAGEPDAGESGHVGTSSVSADGTAPAMESLPNGLKVWDNAARASLSVGLYIWLAWLVSVNLGSLLFLRGHGAARWVLAGFLLSHLIVFSLPCFKRFVVRRGTVSLLHVICWSPGVLACLVEGWQILGWWPGDRVEPLSKTLLPLGFLLWSTALVITNATSFIFDLRDAATYVKWLVRPSTSS
ncbi:MAG: hypothetical protein ACR2NZ_02475 [Rubripirellula sp.]